MQVNFLVKNEERKEKRNGSFLRDAKNKFYLMRDDEDIVPYGYRIYSSQSLIEASGCINKPDRKTQIKIKRNPFYADFYIISRKKETAKKKIVFAVLLFISLRFSVWEVARGPRKCVCVFGVIF